MKTSRSKFVVLFLACGYAYGIATRLILNQMPASLYGSDFGIPQAAWQSAISRLLFPIKLVLMGPLRPLFSWMLSQQDADPPPPMLAIMYAFYWIPLALLLHYILSRRERVVRSTG
jgi:hypothetical protein